MSFFFLKLLIVARLIIEFVMGNGITCKYVLVSSVPYNYITLLVAFTYIDV